MAFLPAVVAIAGDTMLAGALVVGPLTGGPAALKQCQEAQENLSDIVDDYKTMLSNFGSTTAVDKTSPTKLVQLQSSLLDKTYQQTQKYTEINGKKSKQFVDIQIAAIVIIAVITCSLFVKYVVFSKKKK